MALALVLDLETTGLLLPELASAEDQPRIIELGAALVDKHGESQRTFSELINPGVQISDEITRITKLRNEDLAGKPPLVAHLSVLKAMFAAASALIAHNLPFDKGVLSADIARMEHRTSSSWLKDWPWPPLEICTVQAYTHEWGRRMKLTELYEAKLKRPLAQTHRALDDVLALVEVLKADHTLEELL